MIMHLYHGSKVANLKALKPFPHNGVNGSSVVFATPDVRFALAMIHGTGDELAVGYFVDQESHKEEMYIDELVPHAFNLLKSPGVLYEVSDSGFVTDPDLSHLELISKKETEVVSEKYIPDVLEELRKYEINFVVYEKVLDEMKNRNKDPKNAQIEYGEDRFKV